MQKWKLARTNKGKHQAMLYRTLQEMKRRRKGERLTDWNNIINTWRIDSFC